MPKYWWPISRTNSIRPGGEQSEVEDHDPITFECGEENCEYQCSTINALNFHYFDKHDKKHPIRQKVDNSCVCLCCLGYYHCRVRVIDHLLLSSHRCRLFYQHYIPNISEEMYGLYERNDSEYIGKLLKSGKRRNHSVARPERVEGPLDLEATRLGISHRLRFRPDKLISENEGPGDVCAAPVAEM